MAYLAALPFRSLAACAPGCYGWAPITLSANELQRLINKMPISKSSHQTLEQRATRIHCFSHPGFVSMRNALLAIRANRHQICPTNVV